MDTANALACALVVTGLVAGWLLKLLADSANRPRLPWATMTGVASGADHQSPVDAATNLATQK